MNATISGSLTAESKGVSVVIQAGGFSLTGSTCTLLAVPTQPLGPVPLRLVPLTVSEDGLSATYITTGTDFEQGGPWLFQLEVVTSDNQVITSGPGEVYIFPKL